MNIALLIIDVQQALCSGEYEAFDSRRVIDRINQVSRPALALGYPVTLVADGHTTMDNAVLDAATITAHHNETLARMDSFGPRVQVIPASGVRFEV